MSKPRSTKKMSMSRAEKDLIHVLATSYKQISAILLLMEGQENEKEAPPLLFDESDNIIVADAKTMTKWEKKLEEKEDYFVINIGPKAQAPWCKFSPAWPHGGIPMFGITGTANISCQSVQGIQNSLSVYEKRQADFKEAMHSDLQHILKKPKKDWGEFRGFAKDSESSKIFPNVEQFRKKVLFPAYKYVLEQKMQKEIEELKEKLDEGFKLLIVDSSSNFAADNPEPFGYGILLKNFLEGTIDSFLPKKRKRRTPKAEENNEGEEEEEHEKEEEEGEPKAKKLKPKKKKEEKIPEKKRQEEEEGEEAEEETPSKKKKAKSKRVSAEEESTAKLQKRIKSRKI